MEQLARLPGIGPKTSERLAYHLLTVPLAEAPLALRRGRVLAGARGGTVVCGRCFQFDEQDPCSICADASRDRTRILVVEDPRDGRELRGGPAGAGSTTCCKGASRSSRASPPRT
jgi:recombination protein RecR